MRYAEVEVGQVQGSRGGMGGATPRGVEFKGHKSVDGYLGKFLTKCVHGHLQTLETE